MKFLVTILRSIKSKLIVLLLAVVFPLTGILGGIGLYNINRLETTRAAETMNYVVKNAQDQLDNIFIRTEDVVHYVASALENNVPSPEFVKNRFFRANLKEHLLGSFTDAAKSIGRVATFYVYFSPDLLREKSDGFWYIKDKHTGKYEEHELTVVKNYGSHAGRTAWFYEPVEKGKAVWLPPYLNENINMHMISYAMPVKVRDTLIAVVGVDIEFQSLSEIVRKIKVFQSGYGFLSEDIGKDILYVHPEYAYGTTQPDHVVTVINNGHLSGKDETGGALISYIYNGQKKEMAFATLQNGMRLIVTAPRSEAFVMRDSAIIDSLIVVILFTTIVLLTAIFFAKKITTPLLEIKEAARRMGSGDYSFTVSKRTDDELGDLADSVNDTIIRMRNYVDTIKKMAYTDELTHVKNHSSYEEKIRELNAAIKSGAASFSVIMVDMNNLKFINDTYGHEKGDLAILKVCSTICDIFKRSPVYRFGGDEFAIILEHRDYECRKQLIDTLHKNVRKPDADSKTPWDFVYVAIGSATFRKDSDESFADVFRRADSRMYACKKKQKGSK